MATLAEAKAYAFQSYQLGDLVQTAWMCQQILQQDPVDAVILHLLGAVYYQSHQWADAIAYYRLAIALMPDYAEAYNSLGVALHQDGQIHEAIAQLQIAITLQPEHPQAYYNLGNVYQDQQQWQLAEDAFRQAIALQPSYGAAHNNLGLVLQRQHQLVEAIAHFRQAVLHQPQSAMAHQNLGNVLLEQGDWAAAIEHYQQAISLQPDNPETYYNLGNAWSRMGEPEAAIAHYRTALSLNPDLVAAHINLGICLTDHDEPEAAIAQLQQALQLAPQSADAHASLGDIWLERGDLTTALEYFDRALSCDPDHHQAHCHRGFLKILTGDLQQGYAEYAPYLWSFLQRRASTQRFPQPQWDGSALDGRTILLFQDDTFGFGDAIQYIRYLPQVQQLGGRVIVLCPSALAPLFATLPDLQQIVTPDDPLPPVDLQASLHLLPWLLGTSLDTIPNQVPYLQGCPFSLPDRHTMPAIGIVWAGAPRYRNRYRDRSCPFPDLLPLLQVPNVTFYSLQKGARAADLRHPGVEGRIYDLSEQLTDFGVTAGAIAQMDLIITVDTAVAHLAGALAKPVWVMLPFAADCRWFLERSDSPWYPTMRLFRQSSPGDWAGVVTEAIAAVRHNILNAA